MRITLNLDITSVQHRALLARIGNGLAKSQAAMMIGGVSDDALVPLQQLKEELTKVKFSETTIYPNNDHEMGWYKETVQKLVEDTGRTMEQFYKWMDGQTLGLDTDTMKHVYYRHDVIRFLKHGPTASVLD